MTDTSSSPAAICDNCGNEFPSIKPGTTDCPCGGQLIFLQADGTAPSTYETSTPEAKSAMHVLLPEGRAPLSPSGDGMTALDALAVVVKVLNHEPIPVATARKAVAIVLGDYEGGLLTALVGAARARTHRLMKLMAGMSQLEDQILDPANIQLMEPNQQLKAYRMIQISFVNDMEILERVVELRPRIEAMMAQGLPLANSSDQDPAAEELTRGLPPARRERLRRTLTRILATVHQPHDS